jgi:hypothetical protein
MSFTRLVFALWLAMLFARGAEAAPKKDAHFEKLVVDLNGSDVAAASKAALALGQSNQPEAGPALIDALSAGLHPEVAAAAVSALGQKPGTASSAGIAHRRCERPPWSRSKTRRIDAPSVASLTVSMTLTKAYAARPSPGC